MKPRVSARDIELLSQYLDQQLGQAERRRLEARLAEETALQAVLEDLRKTRLLLRSTPHLRAPRNFTLSQRQLPSRATRYWAPAMGFVSALASLVLLLVLAGDLFGIFLPSSGQRLAAPAAPQAKSNSSAGLAEATQAASSAMQPMATSPASQDQAIISTPTGTQVPIAAIAEAPQAPPGTSTPDEAERELKTFQAQPGGALSTPSLGASSLITGTGTLPTTETLNLQTPSAEGAIQTTEQPAPSSIPPQPLEKLGATPSAGQGETTGEKGTPEAMAQSQPGFQNGTTNAGTREPSASTRWLLWILEALLALTALGTGILAWVFRQRQRR